MDLGVTDHRQSAGREQAAQISITALGVNRRGIFTPDRRAIETPLIDGVERVGDRSCGAQRSRGGLRRGGAFFGADGCVRRWPIHTCPLPTPMLPEGVAALCGAGRSRRCSRCSASQDEDQGVPQITRSAQARRDALRAPEDAPWLRAPAAQRSLRRSRRVPSRRNRAEPQDAGPAPHPAAATVCMRVSCVASVRGVSVEAEALLGRGQKNPSALHLPDQHTNRAPTALAADFFDSIGQILPRGSGLAMEGLPPQPDVQCTRCRVVGIRSRARLGRHKSRRWVVLTSCSN